MQIDTLLSQTTRALADEGKTWNDVIQIRSGNRYCTVEEFKRYANFTYNSGYGAVEINPNLMVIGKDWWLERDEYDGAEWWTFNTYPGCATEHDLVQLSDMYWANKQYWAGPEELVEKQREKENDDEQ